MTSVAAADVDLEGDLDDPPLPRKLLRTRVAAVDDSSSLKREEHTSMEILDLEAAKIRLSNSEEPIQQRSSLRWGDPTGLVGDPCSDSHE